MSLLDLAAGILYVGHSLVGPTMPPMLEAALRHRFDEGRVEAQIINGAPLGWNWDHSAEAQGTDARAALPSGGYGALVLTEAIPLANHLEWSDTHGHAAAFAGLAHAARPDAQVFIYETWHSLLSGTGVPIAHDDQADMPWRDRIAADLPHWQGIVDHLNATAPPGAPAARLIPAGQALGHLHDAIRRGAVPDLSAIEDVFTDDIHPNDLGWYFLTMVHFAALTGEHPQGLPPALGQRVTPSPELAAAMQDIAWQAVAATHPQRARVGFGLNGISDWSPQQPFIDVMKTARPWTGHLHGGWGGWGHEDLAARGLLDADGWPREVPQALRGIAALILTDLPEDARGLAGEYRVTWDGEGTLEVNGRAEILHREAGEIRFAYTPGPGLVEILIRDTDPHGTGAHIRDISVVRVEDIPRHEAGKLFNPRWLARLGRPALLRMMDWMATTDSTLSRWEDRPMPADYTWGRIGVPLEVILALANETGADPWFTLPHLADDDHIRRFAEAVHGGLHPGLRAWVELSNEVWNPQFQQARWAGNQARDRWGRDGAGVQFYAMRAAQMAAIWAEVFGPEAGERLVRVIATQTGWLGLEEQILDAPLSVAEGNPPPAAAFDAYAVTGYFAALLGHEEKAPMVRRWLDESLALAEAEADGLSPPLRAARIAQRRFDHATALAKRELRDGSVSGNRQDTLAHLLDEVLPYHAEVARRHGLDLVMYEGGTHVVGVGPVVEDADLAEFYQSLNYTPEMADIYAELLNGWAALTDAPFNAFVDVATPSEWGSWGHLRHLDDRNPRWDALMEHAGGR